MRRWWSGASLGLIGLVVTLLAAQRVGVAQGQTTVTLGTLALSVGESGVVEGRIDCSAPEGCGAFAIAIRFDPALIRVDQIEPGPYLGAQVFVAESVIDNDAGSARLAAVAMGATPTLGEPVLLTLHVTGLAPGVAPLTVTALEIGDLAGSPLAAVGLAGAVVVMESAPPTPTPAPSPPPTPQVAPFAVDPDQAAFLLRQQTTWAQPPLYTYNSDREDPQPTPGYVSFDYEGIYVSSTGEASDSDPRISDLGGNRDPVFSPDGRWIAYIHVSGDFETSFVRITDRFGQSVRLIEGDYSAASLNGLSWSADGRLIAFADSDAGGVSIMDVTTGALRMVVGKTGEDISWSPDGQRIAFWVREGSDGNDDDGWVLYVVAPDGSNLTRVTEPDDRRGEFGPLLWTYDSRSLTFVSFPVFGESRGNYETWIVSADGSDPQLMQTGIVVIDQRYYPWLRYRGPGDIWETSVVAAGAYPAIPDY